MPVVCQNIYKTPNVTPSLPAFSNIALCAGLWNFNPVGYPLGQPSVNANSTPLEFNSLSPYAGNYEAYIPLPDPPPFLVDTWGDQNGQINNLLQLGFAFPVLQITTSVVVSGAGTAAANGVYTYRGLDADSGYYPYYNLVGQPSDPTTASILSNGIQWAITKNPDDGNYYNSANGPGDVATAFPWLATGWQSSDVGVDPAPTVTAADPQTGQIDFGTDGAGGTPTTGLQSSGSLCNSATGTIYLLFKAGSLLSSEVLFETGTGAVGAARAKNISISLVAGVLTATIYDNTAVTPLLNSKIRTIADTNWHLLAVTWDVTLSAANQVSLKVDNSSTGVTAPISSTLVGLTIGNALLNVGARNNAASAAFTGLMQIARVQTNADDATAQTNMYNYCKYLNPAIP